jgi:chromosomal replication initiation ATPase DnaA
MIKIWDDVLEFLKMNMSRAMFYNYVERCEPESWRGGILRVTAENESAQEYLNSRLKMYTTRFLRGACDDPEVSIEWVAPCPLQTP